MVNFIHVLIVLIIVTIPLCFLDLLDRFQTLQKLQVALGYKVDTTGFAILLTELVYLLQSVLFDACCSFAVSQGPNRFY
jgi:hypothetical protein